MKGMIIKVENVRTNKDSNELIHRKTYYLKVIADKPDFGGYYRIVKCTKSGKEFVDTTGYHKDLVEAIHRTGSVTRHSKGIGVVDSVTYSVHKYPDGAVGDKVSTDGVEVGIKKRRLKRLYAVLDEVKAEIAALERDLNVDKNHSQ